MGNFSFCLQSISLIEYNDTNRSRRAYGLNCLRINTAGLLYLGVKITNMKHKPYLTIDEQNLAGIIKSDIINLCKKYPFVNLSHYGFIPKWEDLYFKVLDSMSNRIQA